MDFNREITGKIGESITKYPSFLHVVTGPRQVGKSYGARQISRLLGLPTIFANADSPQSLSAQWIEEQWQHALMLSAESKTPVLLVLDELQKIHGWSEVIKKLWDEIKDRKPTPPIRVMMLGSSALQMQQGMTESLAGRFLLHRFSHWSTGEMQQAFGLSFDQAIYFGGYPGAAKLVADDELWRGYIADSLIESVLSRDILQLQKITKPALLRALFFVAAGNPSQIISYNKLTGMLNEKGSVSTIISYLTLLGSAFLVQGLSKYPLSPVKSSIPKLVVLNNALVSACKQISFESAKKDRGWWGRLVENAVGAHLINSFPETSYSISYFRERVGSKDYEVDFVIKHGETVWGIEVTTSRVHSYSGLDLFKQRYPKAKILMLGPERIEDFLAKPVAAWWR